jgi:hypothetical protein
VVIAHILGIVKARNYAEYSAARRSGLTGADALSVEVFDQAGALLAEARRERDHDRAMNFLRGDVWASSSATVPSLLDGGFGLGWERLGDIAEPQDTFWSVVRRYNDGASTPRVVSVWIHVKLGNTIGQQLLAHHVEHGVSQGDESGPRVWLAFAAWSDPNARLLVTQRPARLGISELRAPEVHPGLVAAPSRPLCFRIEAADTGLFDQLA